MSSSSVPDRSDVDPEYRWDLESVYANDEEWEQAFDEVSDLVDRLSTYDGDDVTDGESLLSVLELRDEVMRKLSTVSAYARMRRDEDTRRETYQALTDRAESLVADARSAASFVEPAVQDLGRERVESMIAETEGLAVYEHHLDDVLRTADHTRSPEVEELLADFSEVTDAAGDVYRMLTNADMEFPTVEDSAERSSADRSSGQSPREDPNGEAVEITLNNFTTLQKRQDRAFRRDVYESFYDRWADVRNAVGAAYRNSVKADVNLARARNYETAREAALDDPNVPVEVYDTLVDTVRDNLDRVHRHAELKRRVLDVDTLRGWDLYVPVTHTESPEVPYQEAREHVVDAVAPLGEDYQSRIAEGLDSRWVDVYENRGKRSGAYSSGTYDTQPFILMNYQDDVSSMYTLAHELGHSLHSEYTSENQPYVYSSYEIFVAEVASTVNEALLTDHLLETVDDERFRRHVLNEYLERFRSTMFRQTMFADFEHRVHRMAEDDDAITPDRLDDLYRDLKGEFYEPVELDDRIAREWMRIPHFYRAYYVFQYATGISAAVALASRIREEGETAAREYREFLSKGSREYPLDLLRGAGVDMRGGDAVEAAIEEYGRALDEMESLL
ncbi:oligoendopeptidase F [Halobacteriales archaeon QS_8_69_26]|nr:MAG: oligoendopeptidase F [Halobacteriales archaeon QS_8_69_26]